MPSPRLRWAVPLALFSSVSALQVTPGSGCASLCLNDPDTDPNSPGSSWTNASDIVCENVDYYSSGVGEKYKSCLECLQTSDAVNGSENDLWWFLYNLRFAVSVCLFDFPGHTKSSSTPCDIDFACQPLRGALESGDLDPANGTEYEYCSVNDGAFGGPAADNCMQCMQASTGQTYLANFLVALHTGCKQQPAPGLLLGLTGSLFSTTLVNATAGPVNQTAVADEDSKKKATSSMNTGTIVGIAVAAALLLVGALALLFVYCRRQRKLDGRGGGGGGGGGGGSSSFRRSDLSDKGSHSSVTALTLPPSSRTIVTTSRNNTPANFTMDYKAEAPRAQDYEMREGGRGPGLGRAHGRGRDDYASNAEYYDDLEGKSRGRPLRSVDESPDTLTRPAAHPGDSALPTHPAYLPRSFLASGRGAGRNPSPGSLGAASPPAPRPSPKGGIASHTRSASISTSAAAAPPYAIQAYLGAAEAVALPGPPPGPPPPSSRAARGPQQHSPNPPSSVRSTTPNPPPSAAGLSPPPPPPPPRGRSPSIPSLILPSVPRIRVPKKYPPPRISVQEATPVDGPGALDISGPLAFPEEVARRQQRGAAAAGDATGDDDIIERQVEPPPSLDRPIASGKTYLYG